MQGQVRRRWWRAAGLTLLAGILGSILAIGVHGWFNALEADPEPLHVVWRFEQGPARDLAAERGAWVHRALGPGAMVSNRAVVVLPTALPERPFAVTVQWKPVQGVGANSGSSRVMPVWAHEGQAVPRRVWAAVWQDSWNAQSVIRSRAVFQGRWSALYIDGKLTALNEYDNPYPARRVLLALQNAAVEEIELKEFALDAVPPELQDANRTARTLVPGLTNDL
ncbi:MAG: hypothetical protein JNM56_29700 [Planctomycetia bacterium]|nr:hypothetical protein [Planctomycetia bacterium]